MAQRLFRTCVLAMLTIALMGPSPSRADDQGERRPTIAFVSTRDTPNATIPQLGAALEIYLMNPPDGDIPCTVDSCDPRRLTHNETGEAFPILSPDGKKIVFDSNRLVTSAEPGNTSDLFMMNTDGTEQTLLTRGSSASWSPDSKQVAFHASASGTGLPLTTDPGSATSDSDIFIINVDECLEQVSTCQDVNGPIKRNLTNTADAIDDDPDWSPDGQKIVFTNRPTPADNTNPGEIWVMNADGTDPIQLTFSDPLDPQEKRAPDWSPNGMRILFACRPASGRPFEICVMDANGSNQTQLTNTGVFHGTPVWSPDGTKIAFHGVVLGEPGGPRTRELWTIDVDAPTHVIRLTDTPGLNHEANWGVVRIPGQGQGPIAASSNHRSADTARGPAVDDGTDRDRKADHGKQGKAKKGKKDTDKKDNKDKKHKGGGKRHR